MTEYFQGFNYSLANEDTTIEYDLLPYGRSSILAVCGSGARVLPLLARNPKQVHIVDLSRDQLALFRLRYQAVKMLDYHEFLYFMGYATSCSQGRGRADLMKKLRLTPQENSYWKEKEELWKGHGFIYLGKWEKHFMLLGRVFRKITFSNFRPIFEASTLDEQRELLKRYWHPLLFKLYTKTVMNERVANKLLYKGSFAGSKGKNTMDLSAGDYVVREFNDLFNNTLVRNNFFLQLIFLGQNTIREGFPIEAREDIFQLVKKSEPDFFYHQENLLGLIKKIPFDFYSLSDTFSYMSDDDVKNFLDEMPNEVKPESQVVVRTFMRKPRFEISESWSTDPAVNSAAAKNDCTRMYEFSIIKKN